MKKAKQFIGYATIAAGGAGNESYVELWNPVTTRVIGRLKKIMFITAETGGYMKLKYHTAKQGSTAQTAKGNKQVGGSAPLCELYANAAASVLGTQIGVIMAAAATRYEVEFPEPIEVAPGQSCVFENLTANLAINHMVLEWEEVPV